MISSAELVVVGAGTVGGWASVVARQDGAGRVVVVDAGLAGQGASSRAAGIVHAQGGTPTAVDLALHGATAVTDVSFLGADRCDADGRSRLAADPIALPFPGSVGPRSLDTRPA